MRRALATIRVKDEPEPGVASLAFECVYLPPYSDDVGAASIEVQWVEGPSEAAGRVRLFCLERSSRRDDRSELESGVRPLRLIITSEVEDAGLGAVASHLASLAAERTPLCPGVVAPSDAAVEAAMAALERIEDELEERRIEIVRIAEAAQNADGDEEIRLLADAYEKEASSVEILARDMASAVFPETAREAVEAVIVASETEARLWREVARDRAAIVDDRIEAAVAALEARRAAVARLRRILGVRL